MTIYLLDGCSANVIIKNNFSPFPCIWSNFSRISWWITGKKRPLTGRRCSPELQMFWAGIGDIKGRGWGCGKLSCIT